MARTASTPRVIHAKPPTPRPGWYWVRWDGQPSWTIGNVVDSPNAVRLATLRSTLPITSYPGLEVVGPIEKPSHGR